MLRRHGMQDLLQEATNDNEETAVLLGELERMPKNGAEFIGKASEFGRAFQQHIRDGRKELLPAVLRVLSDEEANTIAETVEDEMANIDETKRAEARRSRDQVETIQRVTEEASHNLRAIAQSSNVLAHGLQDVSREVMVRSQRRLQRNLDGFQALVRCRSITDLFEVQSSLLRDNLEQTLENSRRIAELTIQVTDEATKTVTVQAEKTARHLSRAA